MTYKIINTTQPIPIKYIKNNHGFSDSNNDTNRYLFELIIKGKNIGKKYFRNLENNKYSHLIKLEHHILLSSIDSYKASLKIYPSEIPISSEIEGSIHKELSSSTQSNDDLYIEFTQNDNGYALCSCFYVGLNDNKYFASPPN